MVILEGPDNSGKTQLSLDLHRMFGWPVEHSNKPDLEAYQSHDKEFMAYMHAIQHLSPKALIRDRTYAISENVYGPIVRSASMLGVFREQALKFLANTQTPIVYCRPPVELIMATTKKEMDGVRENHSAIVQRYDKIMDTLEICGAFVLRYDYTRPDAWGKLTRHLMAHIRQFNKTEDKVNDYFKGI